MPIKKYKTDLQELTKSIQLLVEKKKRQISRNINNEILLTYWEVGKLIVDRETKKNIDQKSSRVLILELSKVLSIQIGKGTLY